MVDVWLMIVEVLVLIFVILIILKLMMWTKGGITIQLNKFEYSIGETVSGSVILKLKKDVEAKSLKVGIIGERKQRSYSKGKSTNRTDILFNFKKPLDEEKIYHAGENKYEFELKIPENLSNKITTGNQMVDSFVNSVQALGGGFIRWYVVAELEMKGFDMTKRIQINI